MYANIVAQARANVKGVAQALELSGFKLKEVNAQLCEITVEAVDGYIVNVNVSDDEVAVTAVAADDQIVSMHEWSDKLDKTVANIKASQLACEEHAKERSGAPLPKVTGRYHNLVKGCLPKTTTDNIMKNSDVSLEEFMGGVEYWMRVTNKTLDHLSKNEFLYEVKIAVDCIVADVALLSGKNLLRRVLASYA